MVQETTRGVRVAKWTAILGFLALLTCTYYLRWQLMELNRVRTSADHARAGHQARRLIEDFPDQQRRHEVELRNYELQKQHYELMLALYRSDAKAYAERMKEPNAPPQIPQHLQPPRPPEEVRELAEIQGRFLSRRHEYFASAAALAWVAWLAALAMAGGLLYLVLFEPSGRFVYLALLAMGFVFLIGPAFHSLLSVIAGFLEPPGL